MQQFFQQPQMSQGKNLLSGLKVFGLVIHILSEIYKYGGTMEFTGTQITSCPKGSKYEILLEEME